MRFFLCKTTQIHRDYLQLSIFSKRRTTFFSVGGWVRVKKSIFLVFFSPNSNIPRYVSCLDNIIHDHHFICSHDILFKYKSVFIKYPYDALFKYVRQKGFFVYSTWWNKITNQNLLYNKCPQVHIRLVSTARRIAIILNSIQQY